MSLCQGFGKLVVHLLPRCLWASGIWSPADCQLAKNHLRTSFHRRQLCSLSPRHRSSSAVHYRCLHNTVARQQCVFKRICLSPTEQTPPPCARLPDFHYFPICSVLWKAASGNTIYTEGRAVPFQLKPKLLLKTFNILATTKNNTYFFKGGKKERKGKETSLFKHVFSSQSL